MRQSYMDTDISRAEFKLLVDQEHLEKVWSIMDPIVRKYVDGYLEGVSHYKDLPTQQDSYAAFLSDLIKQNDKLHDKYHAIFALDLMEEEYSEDIDGFKGITLKKECDVIRKTLQSKSEALNDWKAKFYGCKSQVLYDTFYNMMSFAMDYDRDMDTISAPALLGIFENNYDGTASIMVDAGKLEYISSAGLRVMLMAVKKLGAGSVTVINTSEAVKEIFETTGFDQMITVE